MKHITRFTDRTVRTDTMSVHLCQCLMRYCLAHTVPANMPQLPPTKHNQGITMHNHRYTYKPTSKPSKAQDVLITVSCLAVFALWGVLLALGV